MQAVNLRKKASDNAINDFGELYVIGYIRTQSCLYTLKRLWMFGGWKATVNTDFQLTIHSILRLYGNKHSKNSRTIQYESYGSLFKE